MTLREAAWRDAWRLYRWRNHESTRSMMLNTGYVGVIEHARWLRDGVDHISASRIYIVEDVLGRAVATFSLRLLDEDDLAEISVTVDPKRRRLGVGRVAVMMAVQEAQRIGRQRLVADVKQHNIASLKAFDRAGFVERFRFRNMVRLERT